MLPPGSEHDLLANMNLSVLQSRLTVRVYRVQRNKCRKRQGITIYGVGIQGGLKGKVSIQSILHS